MERNRIRDIYRKLYDLEKKLRDVCYCNLDKINYLDTLEQKHKYFVNMTLYFCNRLRDLVDQLENELDTNN